jgi:hypothetical protein
MYFAGKKIIEEFCRLGKTFIHLCQSKALVHYFNTYINSFNLIFNFNT